MHACVQMSEWLEHQLKHQIKADPTALPWKDGQRCLGRMDTRTHARMHAAPRTCHSHACMGVRCCWNRKNALAVQLLVPQSNIKRS